MSGSKGSNSKNTNTKGKAQPKVQRKRRNRRNRRRGLKLVNVGPNSTYLSNSTIRHRELWSTLSFGANSNTVEKLNFADGSFPPWFDKARRIYEMYQLHYIRIYTKASAASTTSGTYVLSYNTNEYQVTDERTLAQLAGQMNAKQGKVYSDLSVVIPASALKNFRTNTQTAGISSWSFNVELGMAQNSVALTVPIWIEYIVTFRNPQV